MRKFLILVAILIMFIGCFENPPNRVLLNVPYHQWLEEGYCTIACIQMWADYDGHYVNQGPIADAIGTWPNPNEIVLGVNLFTNSFGWLEFTEGPDDFNQDSCIAFSIACVNDNCPSIMPFNAGMHGVLASVVSLK